MNFQSNLASSSHAMMEPGTRVLLFSQHLSRYCPSSFEGAYGHIRYLITVVLETPWKIKSKQFHKTFKVLRYKNLNYAGPLIAVS